MLEYIIVRYATWYPMSVKYVRCPKTRKRIVNVYMVNELQYREERVEFIYNFQPQSQPCNIIAATLGIQDGRHRQ